MLSHNIIKVKPTHPVTVLGSPPPPSLVNNQAQLDIYLRTHNFQVGEVLAFQYGGAHTPLRNLLPCHVVLKVETEFNKLRPGWQNKGPMCLFLGGLSSFQPNRPDGSGTPYFHWTNMDHLRRLEQSERYLVDNDNVQNYIKAVIHLAEEGRS